MRKLVEEVVQVTYESLAFARYSTPEEARKDSIEYLLIHLTHELNRWKDGIITMEEILPLLKEIQDYGIVGSQEPKIIAIMALYGSQVYEEITHGITDEEQISAHQFYNQRWNEL
jgi:hypothetical protein